MFESAIMFPGNKLRDNYLRDPFVEIFKMGVPSSAIAETKRLNEIHYLKGKLKTFSIRVKSFLLQISIKAP